ncbi:Papain-like cysteine protease C1 [Phytophthora megakarya]|uniref:Papain-like cysteine protease C1 n=1 Tax=Phytophthora megakarya TaxID=4795 RepID=A0A225W5T2_9STRA|nr:Papain-like cysteine protease C1 [Phytophthora megakarya]
MHAAIVDKYHRYLAVKQNISDELDEWLMKYGPQGEKNGYIPVTESRSSDDALEDQRQRFYLTKEQIEEAREANPFAQFTVDGPFTLMTMDEFEQFLSNTHIKEKEKEKEKTEKPSVEKPTTLSEKEKSTSSTDGSKKNDSPEAGVKDDEDESKKKKKTFAPATEGPTVIAAMRKLRSSGKSLYAFNGGEYNDNGERGFESTSENYINNSPQTYQSPSTPQTYQANTANTDNTGNNGGNTNGGNGE